MTKVAPWITRDLLVVYVVLWLVQLWLRHERKKDPARVIMNERLGWLFIAAYSLALIAAVIINGLAP